VDRGGDDGMNRIEFNPSRFHECTECGELVTDGWVYRLNAHEVVCLPCFVEAAVCLWTLGGYDQRAER
jgi:hypothetical protein